VPNKPGIDSQQAIATGFARAASLKPDSFKWREWKSLRDEGAPDLNPRICK
jgi:hypothetical protein